METNSTKTKQGVGWVIKNHNEQKKDRAQKKRDKLDHARDYDTERVELSRHGRVQNQQPRTVPQYPSQIKLILRQR